VLSIVPLPHILDNFGHSPMQSPRIHDLIVERYGRSVRVQGAGPVSVVCTPHRITLLKRSIQWDQRLLTFDPVAINHVARNPNIYEKPWQTQRFISNLVGCGLLSAEGIVHKRQRRVITPAFSIQNLRAFESIMFEKCFRLRNRWRDIVGKNGGDGSVLDVYLWVSRATFDVIGTAGSHTVFLRIGNVGLMVPQALTTSSTRSKMKRTSSSAHTGRCLNLPSRNSKIRRGSYLESTSQSQTFSS